MNVAQPKLPEVEDDLFYFESDHLALKGNKDYSEILKTIFILESQRTKAIQDYDKVVELRREAADDPIAFVQKLKNGESLGVPELQMIAEVPNIHWSKYEVPLPEEGLKFINSKNNHKAENIDLLQEEINLKNNSETHNKPWSTEEQRRLEELLVIYPTEPIEFRRFKKIAKALGNRTVKQVSSRVQKYFLKLYRAGLPIPGRIPKYAERCKTTKLHLHQRFNHYLFKPTTFFPQLDVPVVMNEAEEIPGPSTESTNPSSFVNYLIPSSSRLVSEPPPPLDEQRNDVDIQLDILQKVKNEKQKANTHQLGFRHLGYKCDYCNEEPIQGTRWHCETCESDSIDFCSDCIISQMYSGNPHPLAHKVEPVRYDDTVLSTMYSDSSSESVSGSAFDSSNKNLESSNELSSSSDSDEEQFDEAQNSMEDDDFANVTLKYGQEEGDEGDMNDLYCNLDVKAESMYVNRDFNSAKSKENCFKEQDNNEGEYEYEVNDYEIDNHEAEENLNITEDDFTETQNVSYSYLHSNLLLDNNAT